MKTTTTCPECGEALEASVTIYLSDVSVSLLDDGRITSAGDDVSQGPMGAEVKIYCPNNHDFPGLRLPLDVEVASRTSKNDAERFGWPTTIDGIAGGMYTT